MEKMDENMGEDKFFNEGDVEFRYTRSSGPGGQNVNKRETAVQARLGVDKLLLSEEDKERLKSFIPGSHLTKNDEVVAENSEERSRERNKEKAVARLKGLIKEAVETAKREESAEKHRMEANRPKKGGGSTKESPKEAETKKGRSARTEDWLEEAFDDDPDLEDRIG